MKAGRTRARSPHRTLYAWSDTAAHSTAAARLHLRTALTELGVEPETVADAELCVTELVSNTRHAKGPYELRLRILAAEILVEVHDRSPAMPEIHLLPALPDPAPGAEPGQRLDALLAAVTEHGRGLALVAHLTSTACGFRRTSLGKSGWFALPLPVPSQPHGA